MIVHPTALVDPSAELADGVEVGPFSIVEAGVRLGSRTRVLSHVVIRSGTDVGPDCEIHMGAVVGHTAQIRGHRGAGGGVRIGAGTCVREQVTIHAAREPGYLTIVGRHALLLAGCHVAHDCQIGDETTIANGALLAGSVTLGDRVFVSGNVVIHQFVQVGRLAMLGGQARVSKDAPPFMIVVGNSEVRGPNVVGLRRAGMDAEARGRIMRAYRILYRSGLSVTHALQQLRALLPADEISVLIAFIEGSRRGICRGPRRTAGTSEDAGGLRTDTA